VAAGESVAAGGFAKRFVATRESVTAGESMVARESVATGGFVASVGSAGGFVVAGESVTAGELVSAREPVMGGSCQRL
jgi:hypothetical protein